MNSQDKLEQVLRALHVYISECRPTRERSEEIVVNKRQVLEYLNRLSVAIYGIMDEYEVTKQGKERAEREMRKKSKDIVKDAGHQAEDVYAASIVYTNDALQRIQNIMQEAMDSFELACRHAKDRMEQEKNIVQSNQTELQGQLIELKETDKYLQLIEDTNKRIRRQMEAEEQGVEPSPYANTKPEIRINPEYFERIGVPMDKVVVGGVPGNSALVQYSTASDEFMYEIPSEMIEDVIEKEVKKTAPEIRVNQDAAYFKQKEKMQQKGNSNKKGKKR